MKHAFDLVVRGGTIVDGTGRAPFEGDVAIAAGRIAQVGRVSGSGAEELSAQGMIVTPGFVDIHTHYDGQITWEHRLTPSSLHGATTVVMGNCGVGFAPARAEQHEMMIALMEGVEDIPGSVMAEGVPWAWETFPEYLDFLEQRPCDVDFATQVAHAPVRIFVMGQRGADREPATAEDMRQMAQIVRDGVAAGALGFSTARTLNHRRKDGVMAPTVTAGEEELLAIALALKSLGHGVLQFIDDFIDTTAEHSTEFAMWRRIAQASGRPLSLSLVQKHRLATDQWQHLLRFIEDAGRSGLDVTAQVATRPIGVFLSLDFSTHPFSNTPTFAALAHLPLAQRVAEMRKPEVKARILAESPAATSRIYAIRTVAEMVEFVKPLTYFPPPEAKLKVRAAALGNPPLELAYDLLLKDDGRCVLFHASSNYADNTDEVTRVLMQHPATIFGLGDGGAHLGMICDASQSTYALTYWTRDRPGERLSLPWIVHALTQRAAANVGLNDRGCVAPGYKGDLNVIDCDRLSLQWPEMVADLPAGGRRLTQKADGYVATVVNGVATYRDGTPTGKLPGKLIRGLRTEPR